MSAKGNSWQWACTKLLEGERLHWKHWGAESWIQVDQNSTVVVRVSRITRKNITMGSFRLSVDKMTEDGWSLYKDPPVVIRDEILFRRFR